MQRGLMVLSGYADRLAGGGVLAIGYLSLTPLPNLPDVPGNDKLHHLVAYAVLTFLATLSRRKIKEVLTIFIAVIAYGGLIETIQPYVNRYGEFGDFLANGAGAVLGVLLALGVTRGFKA